MKFVKFITIAMGIAIIVLTGVLIYGMATKYNKTFSSDKTSIDVPSTIELVAGAKIIETNINNNRLLIRVEIDEKTQQLIIYDLTGKSPTKNINIITQP